MPPKKRISALLKDFQTSKAQMAIVTDQYGGTLGILTVEDIIEELVGEIWDEDEEIITELTHLSDHQFLVSGDMKVSDFFEKCRPSCHSHADDSSNISGWAMEKLEKVPMPGEQFEEDGVRVVIREVEEQRVKLVEITLLTESGEN